MDVRALGDSDLAVSVVSLGTNNVGRGLDQEATRAVVDAALDEGITLIDAADIYAIPYSPLASGLLAGKYRRGRPRPTGTRIDGRDEMFTDRAMDVVEALAAFAESRDIAMLDVAIGRLAAQPAVSSEIAGAMTPEQVRANARAGPWAPSELDRIAAPVSSE